MGAQAEAVQPASAASQDAGTPQIDADAATLEQLDQLFETGSAELPVKSDGEEKKGQEAASTAKEPETPKAGDPPPKAEDPPKTEDPPAKVDEVVETRSTEEVEQAVTEAVEKVKADGGDQAAQDEAAEAARQPAAKIEEAPKVEPVKPKAEEPDGEKSRRFRVKDPIAQAALEIYKTFENTDTPITLAEAERRVRGGDAPPKKEEAPAKPNLDVVVSGLELEVQDIKAKLLAAGGDEGLYTKEIAELNQQLVDKTADLRDAKRDLREAAETAQVEAEETATAWKQTVANSRAKAIEQYPDVANESTPLGKAVSERITAMRDKSHPDHNILFAGSAPETITRMVAIELGIQPATKQAAPPPKKPETPPKPKKVEPASGAKSAAGKGPTPEDAKNTVEYLKSDKATLEELDNAFGAGEPAGMLQRLI